MYVTHRNQTWNEAGELIADEEVQVLVPPPSREESAALAARLSVIDKIKADVLTDDEVAGLVSIFPDWTAGIPVTVGDVYQWDGTLVEVLQSHTTQADWTPDVVPALFKIHRTPGMTEWIPGILVLVGEQFTYESATYQVVQEHTTQVGWEPPNVLALWTLVV